MLEQIPGIESTRMKRTHGALMFGLLALLLLAGCSPAADVPGRPPEIGAGEEAAAAREYEGRGPDFVGISLDPWIVGSESESEARVRAIPVVIRELREEIERLLRSDGGHSPGGGANPDPARQDAT